MPGREDRGRLDSFRGIVSARAWWRRGRADSQELCYAFPRRRRGRIFTSRVPTAEGGGSSPPGKPSNPTPLERLRSTWQMLGRKAGVIPQELQEISNQAVGFNPRRKRFVDLY